MAVAESRKELVDASHAYYQSQFDNLELTKSGVFGTARVELSKIKSHARSGGDPAYRSKEYANSFVIYGNHGLQLDGKLEVRYHRFANGDLRSPDLKPNSMQEFVQQVAKRFLAGNFSPVIKQVGDTTLEARPFRLSKPECISCHSGMKIGDPVAIGVWIIAPKKK